MADTGNRKPSGSAPGRGPILSVVKTDPATFVDELTVKRALSALQRGPVRFRRDKVIACEGDAADFIFMVVDGVVRSSKMYRNGSRSIVAFYLPGDLFGWSDQEYSLSVEAASDAMVLFLRRDALMSVAARESRVANFLLDLATNELRKAHEHALLMNRSAKCRVATFLTDLSKKSGTGHVNLPMSHQDIADYLGITIETLSRTITEFERLGLLVRKSARTLTLRSELDFSHELV
jgi:CRP/FNR family transcriptional regulator, nitrogen fixation regulation protein